MRRVACRALHALLALSLLAPWAAASRGAARDRVLRPGDAAAPPVGLGGREPALEAALLEAAASLAPEDAAFSLQATSRELSTAVMAPLCLLRAASTMMPKDASECRVQKRGSGSGGDAEAVVVPMIVRAAGRGSGGREHQGRPGCALMPAVRAVAPHHLVTRSRRAAARAPQDLAQLSLSASVAVGPLTLRAASAAELCGLMQLVHAAVGDMSGLFTAARESEEQRQRSALEQAGKPMPEDSLVEVTLCERMGACAWASPDGPGLARACE